MLDYQLEPPSKKLLKRHFIDSNRDAFPQDTLNCVAHLILAIEDPREMMAIALEFIVQKLSACRADIGFLGPHDPLYNPASIYYNKANDPPDYNGVVFSNQIGVFQKTWRQRAPVVCDNVRNHPMLRDSRRKFESIQSKSILFQRLTLDRMPVGLTCVDFTHEAHVWTLAEVRFMEDFCETFLGPLMGISQRWHEAGRHQIIKKPTKSELMAIRLAAKGLSYKQIADELGKSVRTIENQLRSAREALNAANQAELISKCDIWLR
jgi:hypothetical protein